MSNAAINALSITAIVISSGVLFHRLGGTEAFLRFLISVLRTDESSK